jgi:hypothetical protein
MKQAQVKLINQRTHFPSWFAYVDGQYVGKIEKDQYGVWRLYNKQGISVGIMGSFAEARKEAGYLTRGQR